MTTTTAKSKYGMELILDIHDCDISKFTRKNLDSFFYGLCKLSKMTPVGKPKYWHETSNIPHLRGYSGVQFIKTSDIIIHTLDITRDAYINFFSCKDFDVPKVIAFIVEHFSVGKFHYHVVSRGSHRDQSEQEMEIRLIDQDQARYDTWGDYFVENDKLIFQIVRSKVDIYTKLTLIHEMIECFLLEHKGITPTDVDNFDLEWKNPDYEEPGDDPLCPYKYEHHAADEALKIMCDNLGISFNDYMEG